MLGGKVTSSYGVGLDWMGVTAIAMRLFHTFKLNITTQNANALAILGYAADAIMCEKLTIASQVKIEI